MLKQFKIEESHLSAKILHVVVTKNGRAESREIDLSVFENLKLELGTKHHEYLNKNYSIGSLYNSLEDSLDYAKSLRKMLGIKLATNLNLQCLGQSVEFHSVLWEILNLEPYLANLKRSWIYRGADIPIIHDTYAYWINEILVISSRFDQDDVSDYPLTILLGKYHSMFKPHCKVNIQKPQDKDSLIELLSKTNAELIHFDIHGEITGNEWKMRFGADQKHQFHLSSNELFEIVTPEGVQDSIMASKVRTIIFGACWGDSSLKQGQMLLDLFKAGINVIAFKWELSYSAWMRYFDVFYYLLLSGKDINSCAKEAGTSLLDGKFKFNKINDDHLSYSNHSCYLHRKVLMFANEGYSDGVNPASAFFGWEGVVNDTIETMKHHNAVNLYALRSIGLESIIREVYIKSKYIECLEIHFANSKKQLIDLLDLLGEYKDNVLVIGFMLFSQDVEELENGLAKCLRQNKIVFGSFLPIHLQSEQIKSIQVSRLATIDTERLLREKYQNWYMLLQKLNSSQIDWVLNFLSGMPIFVNKVVGGFSPNSVAQNMEYTWGFKDFDRLIIPEWETILSHYWESLDSEHKTNFIIYVLLRIPLLGKEKGRLYYVSKDLCEMGFLEFRFKDESMQVVDSDPYLEAFIYKMILALPYFERRDILISLSNYALQAIESNEKDVNEFWGQQTFGFILKGENLDREFRLFPKIWSLANDLGQIERFQSYFRRFVPGIFRVLRNSYDQKDYEQYFQNFSIIYIIHVLNYPDIRSWLVRRKLRLIDKWARKTNVNWLEKATSFQEHQWLSDSLFTRAPIFIEDFRVTFHLSGEFTTVAPKESNSAFVNFIESVKCSDYENAWPNFEAAVSEIKKPPFETQFLVNMILLGGLVGQMTGRSKEASTMVTKLLHGIPDGVLNRFMQVRVLLVKTMISDIDGDFENVLGQLLHTYRITPKEYRFIPDTMIASWYGGLGLIESGSKRTGMIRSSFLFLPLSSFDPGFKMAASMFYMKTFLLRRQYSNVVLTALAGFVLVLRKHSHGRRQKFGKACLQIIKQIMRGAVTSFIPGGNMNRIQSDQKTLNIVDTFLSQTRLPKSLEELMAKNILIAPGLIQNNPSK